ncbi:MAG TPA: glycosyltransferase family A protein [Geomonas sp.]|nr:glycosyltransferase family A protein [Geomonas sp.]
MVHRPRVAVITRTNNRPLLLERAMLSLLRQSFEEWVMVIVNNGGNAAEVDALREKYADRFRGRIIVSHLESPVSLGAACNLGLQACDSEFAALHDDDDSWHPDFLRECIGLIDEVGEVAGVITHSTIIYEEIQGDQLRELSRQPFNAHLKNMISYFSLLARNQFPPISFLFSRRVADEIGQFDELLSVLEDWDFNLRFMAKHDIYVVAKPLAFWHQRPAISSSSLGNTVVARLGAHHTLECQIRNRLLRRDLETNTVGTGTIMHVSRALAELDARLSQQEARLEQIDRSIGKIGLWRTLKRKLSGKKNQ